VRAAVAFAALMSLATSGIAAPSPPAAPSVPSAPGSPGSADSWLASVAAEVVAEFASKGLKEDGLSIALLDLGGGADASYRADVSYYPCSVVKAFYLAYYEAEKEAGRLKDTPELVRAVKDMITVSSNDATGFVVDSITGTTSGPELSGADWEAWKEKRNAVNRFFARRGYRELNANQKTFCEDAYGREQQFRDGGKNRNRMTPAEVARLFREIAKGQVCGPTGTAEMLALLSRDVTPEKPYEDMEPEDARLAARNLPRGTKIWAKSGDAYDYHHLVARVVLPNGSDFVLAVFTKGVKTVPDVIPRVYQKVAARFAEK
jgi:beta-lactamase class A